MPFAPVHFATGPVVVSWNAVQLGYSEDGFSVNVQPFFDRVSSDDFGGRQGPPADEQLLAGIGTIDGAMTKYVKAELDKLSSFQKAGTAGIFPPIGTFIRQDAKFAVLILAGINDTWTFNIAKLARNFEINSGTRYRRYNIGWQAWIDQTDYTTLSQFQNRTLFSIT